MATIGMTHKWYSIDSICNAQSQLLQFCSIVVIKTFDNCLYSMSAGEFQYDITCLRAFAHANVVLNVEIGSNCTWLPKPKFYCANWKQRPNYRLTSSCWNDAKTHRNSWTARHKLKSMQHIKWGAHIKCKPMTKTQEYSKSNSNPHTCALKKGRKIIFKKRKKYKNKTKRNGNQTQ